MNIHKCWLRNSPAPRRVRDQTASRAATTDLPRCCAISNAVQQTWQHIMWYLSENSSRLEDPDHISLLPLLFSQSLSSFFLFSPSSNNHPVWIGRVSHTAFGLWSQKHHGHRTEYRTGTRTQTQPPTAISSQAIVIVGGVVVWFIPSVIHWAPKLAPCSSESPPCLCTTLSWQS